MVVMQYQYKLIPELNIAHVFVYLMIFRVSDINVAGACMDGHHSTLSTSFQKTWEAWEELLTDDILDLYKVDGG